MNILGIMNGTSVDGIDLVLTKIKKVKNQIHIEYVDQSHLQIEMELRNRLIQATTHQMNLAEVSILHHDLGRYYAKKVTAIVRKKKWKVDLVGLHGQTVFHAAPQATLQIGEASYLAAALGKTVIADFRVADLAVGGQGAPIASLFHEKIFLNKKQMVSVHNLGGMSNLTLIDPKKGVQKAFDTGPANILMDLFVQKMTSGKLQFDQDGKWASRGIADQNLVDQLLTHPFFAKKPPKSCGREEFGESFLNKFLSVASHLTEDDQIATLTELTARSIADAYKKISAKKLKEIIFCGGGAKNKYLLSRVKYHLPEVEVTTTEKYGWPVMSIEGAAFALLAAYRFYEKSANLPHTTGAKRSVLLGKIVKV